MASRIKVAQYRGLSLRPMQKSAAKSLGCDRTICFACLRRVGLTRLRPWLTGSPERSMKTAITRDADPRQPFSLRRMTIALERSAAQRACGQPRFDVRRAPADATR